MLLVRCAWKGNNGRLNLVKHWLMEKVELECWSSHVTNTNFMLIRKQRCASFLYVLTEFQRPIQLMAFLMLVSLYRQLMHTATAPLYFTYMFLMYTTVKLNKIKFITCIYKNKKTCKIVSSVTFT